jgi:ribonuclease III family protein
VNGLQLAYLGDSVLELFVREHLLRHHLGSIEQLHKRTVHFTNAKSQAKFLETLLMELSQEEVALVKKGRNSSASQGKKTASVMEYKHATGLETLLGQLYLDNPSRLKEIVHRYIEIGSAHGHTTTR